MATKKAILAAAVREIVQGGVAGLRVDAVVKRAGVSKRMVYHYFGDRGGLIRAARGWAAVSIGNASTYLQADLRQLVLRIEAESIAVPVPDPDLVTSDAFTVLLHSWLGEKRTDYWSRLGLTDAQWMRLCITTMAHALPGASGATGIEAGSERFAQQVQTVADEHAQQRPPQQPTQLPTERPTDRRIERSRKSRVRVTPTVRAREEL